MRRKRKGKGASVLGGVRIAQVCDSRARADLMGCRKGPPHLGCVSLAGCPTGLSSCPSDLLHTPHPTCLSSIPVLGARPQLPSSLSTHSSDILLTLVHGHAVPVPVEHNLGALVSQGHEHWGQSGRTSRDPDSGGCKGMTHGCLRVGPGEPAFLRPLSAPLAFLSPAL